MKYREFGKTGWQVSEIGFGAWAIGGDMWGPQDDKESVAALHRALDLGVNFIDTAQGYGKGHSEEIIGNVLHERNEQIYVATKVPPLPGIKWPPPENLDVLKAFPPDYIIKACEQSLIRLKRDTLDVYQFHTWASGFNIRDEWFEAMQKLKRDGKIRVVGVSVPDTTPDNVIGALVQGRVDAVQVIYNIFEQSPDWNLFPVCRNHGIGVIVRVPFDEGALTGKFSTETTFPEGDIRAHYFRGKNLQAVVERVNEIDSFRKEKFPDMSMPGLALRYCLSHPAVSTVIPGIRTIVQAEMNTAVSDGKLLENEVYREMQKFAWRKDFWFHEVDERKDGDLAIAD